MVSMNLYETKDWIYVKIAILSLIAVFAWTAEWKPNTPQELKVVVPRFDTQPNKVDGELNDSCWLNAARLGNFTEFTPRENSKPEVETEVMIGYDSENLYIAWICHEKDPSKIIASACPRDMFWSDDKVIIQLYPFRDSPKGYFFAVNPLGIQQDAYEYKNDIDITFDTKWKAAANICHDKWIVEMAIPFTSIRFKESKEQHWKVHFARHRSRVQEIYSWSPLSRSTPSVYEQAGDLFIKDRDLHKRINEFLPYAVISRTTKLEDPATSYRESEITGSFGMNGKHSLTGDFVIDWALNPDYSQIETDIPNINLNTTFAFYYPEKRPFFMENKDIYASPIDVVYTRSINDPLIAVKLNSRINKIWMGWITAYDEHTPWIIPFCDYSFPVATDVNSISNIFRIKGDILKDSYIGIIGTYRNINQDCGGWNAVSGIDGNIRFLRNYAVIWQALKSWTKEPDDTTIFKGYPWLEFDAYTSGFDREKFTGEAYLLEFSRKGRYWNVDMWYKLIAPTFRADNGFIDRNDLAEPGLQINMELWVNKWLFEKITPQLDFNRKYNRSYSFREQDVKPSIIIDFRKQTSVSLSYDVSSKSFADTTFNDMWRISSQVNSSFNRYVTLSTSYEFGEDIDYSSQPIQLSDFDRVFLWTAITPVYSVKLEFTLQKYALYDKETKEKIHAMTMFRSNINYQLTDWLSARIITDYWSYAGHHSIEMYPLISFRINPFSGFYIGSTHTIDRFDEPYGYRESKRQVFVKFSYLIGN